MQMKEVRDKKVFMSAQWMIWCIFKPSNIQSKQPRSTDLYIINQRWKIIIICNLNNFIHGWLHHSANKNKTKIPFLRSERATLQKPQQIELIYANWHNGINSLCSTLFITSSCCCCFCLFIFNFSAKIFPLILFSFGILLLILWFILNATKDVHREFWKF